MDADFSEVCETMCQSFNNDSHEKLAQELDVSFLGSANNVVTKICRYRIVLMLETSPRFKRPNGQ